MKFLKPSSFSKPGAEMQAVAVAAMAAAGEEQVGHKMCVGLLRVWASTRTGVGNWRVLLPDQDGLAFLVAVCFHHYLGWVWCCNHGRWGSCSLYCQVSLSV